MVLQEARECVVMAGRRLVETGLIARTWGNISCRISNTHFIITPSGRDYLSLTPADMVEVAIVDCSYTGDIKPSSEKGIHAEVYKLHPEINFVIHTHQEFASAVSVLQQDSLPVSDAFPALGGLVKCAAYGLPGTKKLRRGVAEALAVTKGKAVIMKNHGALCFGWDYNEAFEVAHQLEKACEEYIYQRYTSLSRQNGVAPKMLGEFALSQLTGNKVTVTDLPSLISCESERTNTGIKLISEDKEYSLTADNLDETFSNNFFLYKEAQCHLGIYNKNKNINNIIHATTPNILAVSCSKVRLQPFVDDFAQIAGVSVKILDLYSDEVSNALKKSSAVLMHKYGAFCCGYTKGDATAVSLVVEKNCRAFICAALFGKVKPINPLESQLMRFVYMKKYSKQAYIRK
ncbi:MAG: class aldolase/adducin family protein [Eubacterium sp.]|jgi:L-fuculose-phosphate aldolase|nr:class aldolase/adducin family protein [Eubacterium sp.]